MRHSIKTSGRSAKKTEQLERIFAGQSVVDAKADLTLFVTKADIKASTAGDPCDCAGAVAARRITGSSVAVCFRSVSYVGVPDRKNGHINRYLNGKSFIKMQRDLDLTGEADPGGYTLHAPTISMTLDSATRRAYEQTEPRRTKAAIRLKKRREAIVLGLLAKKRTKPLNVTPSCQRPSGSGMVHFVSEKLLAGERPFVRQKRGA